MKRQGNKRKRTQNRKNEKCKAVEPAVGPAWNLLDELPVELMVAVTRPLGLADLARASLVCRSWHTRLSVCTDLARVVPLFRMAHKNMAALAHRTQSERRGVVRALVDLLRRDANRADIPVLVREANDRRRQLLAFFARYDRNERSCVDPALDKIRRDQMVTLLEGLRITHMKIRHPTLVFDTNARGLSTTYDQVDSRHLRFKLPATDKVVVFHIHRNALLYNMAGPGHINDMMTNPPRLGERITNKEAEFTMYARKWMWSSEIICEDEERFIEGADERAKVLGMKGAGVFVCFLQLLLWVAGEADLLGGQFMTQHAQYFFGDEDDEDIVPAADDDDRRCGSCRARLNVRAPLEFAIVCPGCCSGNRWQRRYCNERCRKNAVAQHVAAGVCVHPWLLELPEQEARVRTVAFDPLLDQRPCWTNHQSTRCDLLNLHAVTCRSTSDLEDDDYDGDDFL